MNWLLLDTAYERGVVAVSKNQHVLSEVFLEQTLRHAELLPNAVEQALLEARLQWNQLEGIGVGKGPGSFIGVRIAMAYAKGLALARGIPLVGLSGLQAFLHEPLLPFGKGMAVVDAKRQELYIQEAERMERDGQVHVQYHGNPQAVSCDVVSKVERDFLIGFGSSRVTHTQKGPSGIGMALLLNGLSLQDEILDLEPLYCREAVEIGRFNHAQ